MNVALTEEHWLSSRMHTLHAEDPISASPVKIFSAGRKILPMHVIVLSCYQSGKVIWVDGSDKLYSYDMILSFQDHAKTVRLILQSGFPPPFPEVHLLASKKVWKDICGKKPCTMVGRYNEQDESGKIILLPMPLLPWKKSCLSVAFYPHKAIVFYMIVCLFVCLDIITQGFPPGLWSGITQTTVLPHECELRHEVAP